MKHARLIKGPQRSCCKSPYKKSLKTNFINYIYWPIGQGILDMIKDPDLMAQSLVIN